MSRQPLRLVLLPDRHILTIRPEGCIFMMEPNGRGTRERLHQLVQRVLVLRVQVRVQRQVVPALRVRVQRVLAAQAVVHQQPYYDKSSEIYR